jgi:hypothetical protein
MQKHTAVRHYGTRFRARGDACLGGRFQVSSFRSQVFGLHPSSLLLFPPFQRRVCRRAGLRLVLTSSEGSRNPAGIGEVENTNRREWVPSPLAVFNSRRQASSVGCLP